MEKQKCPLVSAEQREFLQKQNSCVSLPANSCAKPPAAVTLLPGGSAGQRAHHGTMAGSLLPAFPFLLCLTQVELLWGRGWFPPGLEMSAPPAKCWVAEGTLLCIPPGSEASPHPPSSPLHSLLVFKSSHWLSQEIGCLSSAELQRAPTEPGNPGE